MRFSPHTADDRRAMLRQIGVDSVEDLFSDLPASVRLERPLNLPQGLSESEVAALLGELAAKDLDMQQYVSFLGGGSYDRYIPSVVGEMLRRSEFYTAYTPYQPEISQGTLQAIFEFQSLIAALTGLDIAQASLYDGATAVAEAAMLAWGQTGRKRIVVARSVDPQYRSVLRTYAHGHGLEVVEVPLRDGRAAADDVATAAADAACVIVQHPNFFGLLEDVDSLVGAAHGAGALYIAVADPISLAVLRTPGAYGADVAVGEGQALGIAPSFGGPYLGFMAVRQEYLRRLPGRIVGETADHEGRRGYVLTFQTREQHIRREKATSNICTNQGLMALAATIYTTLLGPHGLRQAAALSIEGAHLLGEGAQGISGMDMAFTGPYAFEVALRTGAKVGDVQAAMLGAGMLGPLDLERFYPELPGHMLLSVTEKRTAGEIKRLLAVLQGVEA